MDAQAGPVEVTEKSLFWSFSLALYARPGVADACLDLQEQGGADVNLALFLVWAGRLGRRLTAPQVEAAMQLVEPWRAGVVAPMRQARRQTKDPAAGFDPSAVRELRERIKALELQAERLEQEALASWRPVEDLGEDARPAEAAKANLASYERALGRDFRPSSRDLIVSEGLTVEWPGRRK